MPHGSASQRSAEQRGTAERSAVLRSAVRRRASDDCDAILYAVLEDPRAVEQFAATKEQHVKFIKDNEVKRESSGQIHGLSVSCRSFGGRHDRQESAGGADHEVRIPDKIDGLERQLHKL